MLNKIKYLKLKSRGAIYAKELKFRNKVSIRNRMKMLKKGFNSDKIFIYNIKKYNENNFLSDYSRAITRFVNGSNSVILNNKVIFHDVFSRHLNIPRNFATIINGRILPIHEDIKVDSIEKVIHLSKERNKIILKPYVGGGGIGIFTLEVRTNKLILNGEIINRADFNKFIASLDKYIITEFVEQGDYANEIFPHSTNSIRVLTMIDPKSLKPFIPIAVHRFGNKTTAPVDNWTRGGLSCAIDIETGTLGSGVTYPKNGEIMRHHKHPDTDCRIEGVKIPNWHQVKTTILKVAELYPYLSYIGWDIVVTNEGFNVIEGNNHSDVNLLQVHKPLLMDPKVVNFYKYHKIIK